jgi:ankyrin repeat protein
MYATSGDHTAVMELLIRFGADVNAIDYVSSGRPALAPGNKVDAYLVTRLQAGYCALAYAVHAAAAKLLLAHGADHTLVDRVGHTFRDCYCVSGTNISARWNCMANRSITPFCRAPSSTKTWRW